ncbi:succinate--hydroxymethylglutarate CoA-transferase-like [Parasteatoda tepidariorum]|uniref:succinate--hydroxymethylglutarate CoA-transferase-like n=1 Tax=Parasteatoda tepidariorum TaxID=114398 RepID=UPI0039BCD711
MLSRVAKSFFHVQINKTFPRLLTGSVNTAKDGPLSGVRILDLSRIVAGPFCTMLLGDLGAEVIKVEAPNGEETRNFGPPFIKDESVYYMSVNRNKKGIVVDIKKPEGKHLIKELAKESDVFVENLVPGKMAKLGLGYEQLKSVAPHLIYCSVSGFGQTGPYSSRPGVDLIAASIGGFLHITGPKDGEPCSIQVPITDIITGIYAHGAIMAALLQRAKTGKGTAIECDLLACQLSALSYIANYYLNAGMDTCRLGTLSDVLVPYEAYKTKDGYFSLACLSDERFKDVCEALNLPDLPLNPKYLKLQDRIQNREELSSHLRRIFETETTEHWVRVFDGNPVPNGPVNSMKGVFNDPQVIHKNLVKEFKHSRVGNVKVVGPAVTFSDCVNEVRSSSPYFGEHTDAVLREILSYSNEQIENLRKSKVVF